MIKTNYLSSVYFVNQPLHVSGIFVPHQKVYGMYATGTCAEKRGVQDYISISTYRYN